VLKFVQNGFQVQKLQRQRMTEDGHVNLVSLVS